MTTARDEILTQVRSALADVPACERRAPASRGRDYDRDRPATPALKALFAERVKEYRARFSEVDNDDAVGAAVTALAEHRGAKRLVVPADLPVEWRPAGCVEDNRLKPSVLDSVDGVVTGCAVAMAEIGAIGLDAGARQGRRVLTLIPDWHVCVVQAAQLVAGLPEGLAVLADAARSRRPITLIGGPSATSDIEFQRVEGVHGPRTLDVIFVRGPNATTGDSA